jgi:predicted nucleotidyltransferase
VSAKLPEETADRATHHKLEPQFRPSAILEALKAHLPSIVENRPVVLAYAFGSIVSGEMTPFSDVDVALVLAPDCELDAYQQFMLDLEIAAEIERRCGIRDVDVRSISDAPLRVQGRVLTEGVLLYCRDKNFRVAYEVNTRKRYFDFQPVLTMMRQAYFAHLEADLREKNLYA